LLAGLKLIARFLNLRRGIALRDATAHDDVSATADTEGARDGREGWLRGTVERDGRGGWDG
jgi:hypothetical protein